MVHGGFVPPRAQLPILREQYAFFLISLIAASFANASLTNLLARFYAFLLGSATCSDAVELLQVQEQGVAVDGRPIDAGQ